MDETCTGSSAGISAAHESWPMPVISSTDQSSEVVAQPGALPEDGLLKLLRRLSEMKENGPRKPVLRDVLCSKTADTVIQAYLDNGAIAGVPVERHEAAHVVLSAFLAANHAEVSRRPVVCSMGTRGTGKSVVAALNLMWFVQSNAIENNAARRLAVEVTFNDDQGMRSFKFDPALKDPYDLYNAVAVRILHRVLSVWMLCDEAHHALALAANDVLRELKTSPLNPVIRALRVLRLVLNAPPSAPVLLSVDELINAAGDMAARGAGYKTSMMMKDLCVLSDEHRDTLYLSFTAYRCMDLSHCVATSNREVFLQPLPPIMPGVLLGVQDPQIALLPIALQALIDKRKRALLRNTPPIQQVLGTVTGMLHLTSGHPRSVQALMFGLEPFKFRDPAPGDVAWGAQFAAALCAWLTPEVVEVIETSIRINMDFSGKETFKDIDLDTVAVNAARLFDFPTSNTALDMHKAFMRACAMGICSFHSSSVCTPLAGHAYLSLPVMCLLSDNVVGPQAPCAAALLRAAKALQTYSRPAFVAHGKDNIQDSIQDGMAFKDVVEAALSLFFLANDVFTLGDLCGRTAVDDDVFSIRLLGGPANIELLDATAHPAFPLDVDVALLSGAAGSIAAEALLQRPKGWLLRPANPSNVACDVAAKLQRADGRGAVLLSVQAKEWFTGEGRLKEGKASMTDVWRSHNKYFTQAQVTSAAGTTVNNPVPNILAESGVQPVHMLVRASPIDAARPAPSLARNECIVDLACMRTWLPTVAYAAQNAHQLRRL